MQKTKAQISCAVTVFPTLTVQFLFFLNSKFQYSSHVLWLHRSVCVRPVWKFRSPVFLWRSSITKHFMCLAQTLRQTFLGVSSTASRKNVYAMYTPLYPTFMWQNWGMQGIPIFLIFAPKHRLWVLVRTASERPNLYPQSMF